MVHSSKLIAHVVTYNSEATIVRCVESLLQSEGFTLGQDFEVWITDNASQDNTTQLLKEHLSKSCRLNLSANNSGFCQAHNEAASAAIDEGAAFFFVVNPDLRLRPQALLRLRDTLAADSRAGSACPKLLRADGQLNPVQPHVFDAAGMYITPSIRHFDRGSQQPDRGQFEQPGYVFGGSGAALLMKADFMIDVALGNTADQNSLQILDEAFFAYREDADLAWRAQWLGWKCRYVPSAVGFHQRVVLPEYRAYLPAKLNAFSVRNRFLLQLNNWSWVANAHCITSAAFRNLLVIAGALLIERTSLGALGEAWSSRKRALAQRKQLLRRKRTSAFSVAQWFNSEPKLLPAVTQQHTPPISSLQVIIVNYNSDNRLSQCLSSLSDCLEQLNQRLKHCTISVIDNASKDQSATRVKHLYDGSPQISIQILPDNLGFAGAINHACNQLRADAVLILNPDVETNAEAISALLDSLEHDSAIGAVAPLLFDPAGNTQTHYSCRRLPTLGSACAELFFLHRLWPANPWTAHYLMRDEPLFDQFINQALPPASAPYESKETPCIVEQPAAACLMVRGAALRRIGGFDQHFWPAWFEDVDFCKRLHQAGYLTTVQGSAKVKHEGGYSKDILPLATYAKAWYENQNRYWRKHHSNELYWVFRTLLSIALLLRGTLSGFQAVASILRGFSATKQHFDLMVTQIRLAVSMTYLRNLPTPISSVSGRWPARFKRSITHLKKALHILQNPEYRVLDREPLAPAVPFARIAQSLRNPNLCSTSELNRLLESPLSGHGLAIGILSDQLRLKTDVRLDSLGNYSDFVVDGTSNIGDGYYDFIIAGDCFQLSPSSLSTLSEMQRIVRPGGYIYVTLQKTLGSAPRKPIEHFMIEAEEPSTERQLESYLHHAVYSAGLTKESALRKAQSLADSATPCELHSLLETDLKQLVSWFSKRNTPITVEAGPFQVPKDSQVHYLLRKSSW